MATSRKAAKKSKSRSRAGQAVRRKPAVKRAKAKPAKSKSTKATSPKAMRLTFAYDGDEVKLVSQQSVNMVVPPSDPVKGSANQKGFWAELKSAQNKTLYRRVMHNPTRNDAEVFSNDPGESVSRAPAPKRKGVFVVVVPKTNQGKAVTLVRSAANKKGLDRGLRSLATGPATEFARFNLKK